MRHTLIPRLEKKALHHEYHTRLCIVSMFALSAVVLVAIVALFPVFISISVEEVSALHSAQEIYGQQKDSKVSTFKDELIMSKTISSGLASNMKTTLLSDAISTVLAVRGEVRISSIVAIRNADSAIVLTLSGTAPTRNGLVAFENRLISTISGATVDSSPEDLVQAKNVAFSFKVTLHTL